MADFTNRGAEATLQWAFSKTPATPPTVWWVKLHIGDPGENGTENPATNTVRQASAWAAVDQQPGGNGAANISTSADVTWENVPASEQYTHISLWTDQTAGECWYKGPMVDPVQVIAGGTFRFRSGNGVVVHT